MTWPMTALTPCVRVVPAGRDLRGDRVHDLSGDVGADLSQGRVLTEGLRQVGGELVRVDDLVGGDGRSQLLEHLGLREIGRGQGREVGRSARLDLLAGVVLEPLGDLGCLGAQVVCRAVLDGAVGQGQADDRLEVDVGQLRQVFAQLPEVEAGQVEGHARLGTGLCAQSRQVDGRQVQARHVEVGEVEAGQVEAGKVQARQVHLHLVGVDLEGGGELGLIHREQGGHVEAAGLALLIVRQLLESLAGEDVNVGLGALGLDDRAGHRLLNDLVGEGRRVGDALTQGATLVGVGLDDAGDRQLLAAVHELLHVVRVGGAVRPHLVGVVPRVLVEGVDATEGRAQDRGVVVGGGARRRLRARLRPRLALAPERSLVVAAHQVIEFLVVFETQGVFKEVGDVAVLVEDQDDLVRAARPGAGDHVVRGGVQRGRGGHLVEGIRLHHDPKAPAPKPASICFIDWSGLICTTSLDVSVW